MKTSITNQNFLISKETNQSTTTCENYFKSLFRRCSLLALLFGRRVQMKARSLSQGSAGWATLITRSVYRLNLLRPFQSKRHLVGLVMVMAGGIGFYSGLFFDPMVYDHAPCRVFGLTDQCYNFETKAGWCFISWYIYLDAIGWAILFLFGAIGVLMFIPQKLNKAWIPASILHAIAWTWIIHVSFFARSYQTYRTFDWSIEWPLILAAAMLGVFGVMMTNQAVLYWENHKKLGWECRVVGVIEMDLPFDQKEPYLRKLAGDWRQIQKMN
jgi:hypothetical protein